MESIEAVWKLTQEWEGLWNNWKVGKFTELVTTEMEQGAGTLYKKLNKLNRDLKVGAVRPPVKTNAQCVEEMPNVLRKCSTCC